MRGNDEHQNELFSYGTLEERVSADHPLRKIRVLVDAALKDLDRRLTIFMGIRDGRRSRQRS
jgi:hypothetical protein